MSGKMKSYMDVLKMRVAKYSINKFLGRFLEDGIGIETDQIEMDHSIRMRSVAINVKQLNEEIEPLDLPFEFMDGFVQEITLDIPWVQLLSDDSYLKVEGLTLTLLVRIHPRWLGIYLYLSLSPFWDLQKSTF